MSFGSEGWNRIVEIQNRARRRNLKDCNVCCFDKLSTSWLKKIKNVMKEVRLRLKSFGEIKQGGTAIIRV